MTDQPVDAAAALDALFDEARRRLAGSPRERLGDWAHSRRLLGIGRAPRIVAVGEAWHVGALLIGDTAVYATADVLRARTEAVRGYTADAQRARSERAAAAARGGFADGEVVHLGAMRIDLDAVRRGEASGPLSLVDGIPSIVWNAAGSRRPLADYLDDQLSLR
ncbi:glutaminase [Microbacterium sp. VKM Ac-2870]|uniref:glutaminase n=1 Tax=Microbacterium sp. VKM Ac-2870 TaxID=2783825 RepID=UPI00188B7D89|nr:glutaminase [Microbacterium sp. VKM Ac-2870]MBF4561316.1 glutaminase [Microbacterium sp. VKM Ac-2870]